MKFNLATYGNTYYFTLTNRIKNQYEGMNETNELSHQIDDFEQGETGYRFDTMKKSAVKMFRYQDIRTSSYCILPKSFVVQNL